jgi:hypothetical protein
MSIRDKVARAIHSNPDPVWTIVDWNAMHPEAQALILRQADAAITAFLKAAAEQGWHMRPDRATKEMKIVGRESLREIERLEEKPMMYVRASKVYADMAAAATEIEWNK